MIVELDIPNDWQRFKLPPALNSRLQELLDSQDREGKLSRSEGQEAKALAVASIEKALGLNPESRV